MGSRRKHGRMRCPGEGVGLRILCLLRQDANFCLSFDDCLGETADSRGLLAHLRLEPFVLARQRTVLSFQVSLRRLESTHALLQLCHLGLGCLKLLLHIGTLASIGIVGAHKGCECIGSDGRLGRIGTRVSFFWCCGLGWG